MFLKKDIKFQRIISDINFWVKETVLEYLDDLKLKLKIRFGETHRREGWRIKQGQTEKHTGRTGVHTGGS